MNEHISILLLAWVSLWLTEVVAVKVYAGEEVPFWMYGVQSFMVVSFLMIVFWKW